MQDRLEKIKQEFYEALKAAKEVSVLDSLRTDVLGKKGQLTQILRTMGSLPAQERPKVGKLVNEVRAELETALARMLMQLKGMEQDIKLTAETLDVTLPGNMPKLGGLHPITRTRRELEDIFIGMGFSVVEGPEVEYDKYNFELMNMPKNHPARDAQDTFYISEDIVLRTHTSPVQARTMLSTKPPISIICPGRVFRFDEVDATHSPVFHQLEGLVVDKGINMGHLRGTLDAFATKFYGEGTKTRLRPSFFPFTEPSAEVDVSCYVCGGKDEKCRVCKGTGWVEILGCGMVNPKVLEMSGIDSTIYSGFAFGMGIDRITTSKYGISDMRMLFENDKRFLEQI